MSCDNLVGQRFGSLIVLKRDFTRKDSNHARWECQCDCGKIVSVLATNLKKKNGTKSCGCYKKKLFQNMITKHGLYHTSEYNIYQNILSRCYNPNNDDYYNYGDRGIKVCAEWVGENGFQQFINDMGMKPFLDASLDRIDNNLGYSKENCRWICLKDQARNRLYNKIQNIDHANLIRSEYKNGKTILELAEVNNCSDMCIRRILNNETWV